MKVANTTSVKAQLHGNFDTLRGRDVRCVCVCVCVDCCRLKWKRVEKAAVMEFLTTQPPCMSLTFFSLSFLFVFLAPVTLCRVFFVCILTTLVHFRRRHFHRCDKWTKYLGKKSERDGGGNAFLETIKTLSYLDPKTFFVRL